MINLDGYIHEDQIKGIYYNSENNVNWHFLIHFDVKQINHNCLATIYELDNIPQSNVENGDEILTWDLAYLCEIDLWNKYYFPKFKESGHQWYYDFGETWREDSIQALADVMKFAMKLGLEKAEIKLY